jgi:cell wall assembly regulator SMI1
MRRRSIIPLVALALAAVGAVGLTLIYVMVRTVMEGLPDPTSADLYPPAPPMPAPAPESAEALLARYEKMLVAKAPKAFAAVRPGLTDAQIDALESKHGFKLTSDLRALYRWRNGEPANGPTHVFPDHKFVGLDDAVAARDVVRRQVKAQTPAQQQTYAAYAGHRDGWLDVLPDGAGDGYFFDPGRSEAEGSFFFSFAETGSYTFYPAFRNYLAAVVEGHEKGVFAFGAQGAYTVDFEKAEALWARHGVAAVP